MEDAPKRAPACCYEGRCSHWIEFEDQMLVAHAYSGLLALARESRAELARHGLAVDADTLALAIWKVTDATRPRSVYFPWGVTDEAAERIVKRVAADVVAGVRRRAA